MTAHVQLGPVRQLGFMVHDIESALQHWTTNLGIGPFFYSERVEPDDFIHRGVPGQAPFAVALANSGPLQIELVQPLDDSPSMWNEFLQSGNEGLQHLAYWRTDYDSVLDQALSAGWTIAHQGSIRNGRFVYFDSPSHNGSVVELSEMGGPKGEYFEQIRKASVDWDGRDPVRSPLSIIPT